MDMHDALAEIFIEVLAEPGDSSETPDERADRMVKTMRTKLSERVEEELKRMDRPVYYGGEMECVEAIKASMTDEMYSGFLQGNVMKYLWRWRKKGGVDDLRKADVYLKWLIDHGMESAAETKKRVLDPSSKALLRRMAYDKLALLGGDEIFDDLGSRADYIDALRLFEILDSVFDVNLEDIKAKLEDRLKRVKE